MHEKRMLLFAHLHHKTLEQQGSNQASYAWESSASPSVNAEPSSAAKQGLSCEERWAKQRQARLRMLLVLILTQVSKNAPSSPSPDPSASSRVSAEPSKTFAAS
jgi:hypothetical protein